MKNRADALTRTFLITLILFLRTRSWSMSLLKGHQEDNPLYSLISAVKCYPVLIQLYCQIIPESSTCVNPSPASIGGQVGNKTPKNLSCSVCAQFKPSRQHLLQTLSYPHYTLTDFITDLLPAQTFTAIWVVVNCFSKMVRFVLFSQLPSASVLAWLQGDFYLHGLPTHIVLYRGLQFDQFWRTLCKALKISLDFFSAYHPQSNGQEEQINNFLE